VNFRNFAFNFFGRTDQQIVVGVSAESHEKLIFHLDDALEKLSLTEEQKTEALVELTKSKGDLESITRIVSGFLTAIYREEVPSGQFAATLFRLIEDWRTAGARIDALGASRNLTPRVTILREAALKAHAAGDSSEAGRLLDQIDQEEQLAEQRLLDHQREIAAEIHLRRQGRVATKDAQISLALAGLRHADAARLIAERIDLLEDDAEKRFERMRSQWDDFYVRGRDKGLNADLLVSIEIAHQTLDRATNSGERGNAQNDLGISLSTLGERESGTARLEEAVAAYRAAVEEWARERVPLDWATTQNNLGAALKTLGERESGTARLEEAVAAYRAALEERPRERVPLDWAMTQNNLGAALSTLGGRESGTARLRRRLRPTARRWRRGRANACLSNGR
jgi:tetratricopeptide (TPR) repeat protein